MIRRSQPKLPRPDLAGEAREVAFALWRLRNLHVSPTAEEYRLLTVEAHSLEEIATMIALTPPEQIAYAVRRMQEAKDLLARLPADDCY